MDPRIKTVFASAAVIAAIGGGIVFGPHFVSEDVAATATVVVTEADAGRRGLEIGGVIIGNRCDGSDLDDFACGAWVEARGADGGEIAPTCFEMRTPAVETAANGVDDDCDGQTDEP